MARSILISPSVNRKLSTQNSERRPVKSYRHLAKRLLEDFENRLRQRDFSPHTIRSYSFVVRSFLNSLLSETFLKTEQATVRAYLDLLSGCRIGELAALRVEDLDFEQRMVVLHGKGRKDRQVPFGNKAGEALKAYLQGRTTGPVFPQERFPDRPMTTRSLARFVSQATVRAGLGHRNPHAFRHSFATHLLNRGVNLRYVQELLGHENLSTTQIYTHVALADLKKTHEQCHPRG